jgi:tetratricopeptide (TPR) repeat protein
MRTALRALALLLAVLVPCWAGAPAGAGEATADRDAILGMLAASEFDELDRHLNLINDAVNDDARPDADLSRAFRAFATSDPALLPQLDAWVEARPESAMALIARGVHEFHRLGILRYVEPFTEASAPLAEDIQARQKAAFIDVQKGLGIKQTIATGFVWSLDTFIRWGQMHEIEQWYRIAINDLPASAAIHRSYLSSFAPWRQGGASWQESMGRLEAAWGSLRKGFGADPDFAWLAGYLDYVKGEASRLQERPDEALAFFDAAVAASADPEYFLGRGRAHLALGNHDAALADFDDALRLDPLSAPAFHGRAMVRDALGQSAESVADLDAAIALDPDNPLYLTDRARFLRELGREEEARRDIDAALRFGKYDPWVQVWRGTLYETADPAVAAAAFERAAALAPAKPAYLKRYAQFLLRREDCAAVAVVARYREACPLTAGCGVSAIELSGESDALQAKLACPD